MYEEGKREAGIFKAAGYWNILLFLGLDMLLMKTLGLRKCRLVHWFGALILIPFFVVCYKYRFFLTLVKVCTLVWAKKIIRLSFHPHRRLNKFFFFVKK
jgi:hypothetical protein